MRKINYLILSALVIGVVALFSYKNAGAVANGNGVCDAIPSTEVPNFDCDQFGTTATSPVIEFLGTVPFTCTTTAGSFSCIQYNYKYTGSTSSLIIDVAIPATLMTNWPQQDATHPTQTSTADANVAGCSALFINGKGDATTDWNEDNFITNTCRVQVTPVGGGGTFSLRAQPSSPGPLAWFMKRGSSTPGPGVVNGPSAAQSAVAQTGATLTSGNTTISYSLVGGQITITSGTASVVPISNTKLCLPWDGVHPATPTFTNASGSFACETITFATEQCDIQTKGSDPCRFVGGSCIAYSSLRFKDDVRLLSDDSRGLLRLHPISFHYKPEYSGGTNWLQYGLIAEEVAKVMPELAVLDEQGQPFAVRYNLLPVLLLNEVQRQEQERGTLQAEVEALRTALKAVEARLESSMRPDGK